MNRKRMVEASLTASAIDFVRLSEMARELERHIRLVPQPDAAGGPHEAPVHLHLNANRLPEPIIVDPARGVEVSTWDVDGVCAYAGIDRSAYLLICSLVGMAHWRVLDRNSLLKLEDLRHPAGVHCVYTEARHVSDFATILEEPAVCKGCIDFYLCLGAEAELLALRDVLAETSRRAPSPAPPKAEARGVQERRIDPRRLS